MSDPKPLSEEELDYIAYCANKDFGLSPDDTLRLLATIAARDAMLANHVSQIANEREIIAALKADNITAQRLYNDAIDANDKLQAEVARLREALKPLANCDIPETDVPLKDEWSARYFMTVGEIRAAQAALTPREADSGKGE